MRVEIVNTGSELMLGRVLNSHQQWLCRQLTDRGYLVDRQVAVADTGPDIETALREALGRANLVIMTGGLGPTSDDLTRDHVAKLLGRRLTEDPSIVERIREFFTARKRNMPEKTRIQALVPEGALVLPNPNGTAPGLAIHVDPNPYRASDSSSWVIMLPGPPRELRPMFSDQVLPLIARVLPKPSPFECQTVRTSGIGESEAEERIAPHLAKLVTAGLQVGYCARSGEVDIRLAASGPQAESTVGEACRIVGRLLSPAVYGGEDETIESAVVRRLAKCAARLAIAESCTGGLISNRVTNVPGASAVFVAGFVTYSNDAKREMLGVNQATLNQWGAVSEPVAKEMAEGARRRVMAEYAIAVTGIAGPSGGTSAKPVGTVFIALSTASGTVVQQRFNPYDRETFKQVTSQQALEMLRRALPLTE